MAAARLGLAVWLSLGGANSRPGYMNGLRKHYSHLVGVGGGGSFPAGKGV